MATRTSHSSPCFLRVADASAASSASKITSLSTPFSLETASTTIRISLFTRQYLSKFPSRRRASGGEPRLQLDEHPRADEAAEVLARAQHAVEAGRGHLERVGARNRVLDVEERGDL